MADAEGNEVQTCPLEEPAVTASSRAAYAAGRGAVLRNIVDALSRDDRFAAAWLTGSFGRGEQDEMSDLDLSLLTTVLGGPLLEEVQLECTLACAG